MGVLITSSDPVSLCFPFTIILLALFSCHCEKMAREAPILILTGKSTEEKLLTASTSKSDLMIVYHRFPLNQSLWGLYLHQ